MLECFFDCNVITEMESYKKEIPKICIEPCNDKTCSTWLHKTWAFMISLSKICLFIVFFSLYMMMALIGSTFAYFAVRLINRKKQPVLKTQNSSNVVKGEAISTPSASEIPDSPVPPEIPESTGKKIETDLQSYLELLKKSESAHEREMLLRKVKTIKSWYDRHQVVSDKLFENMECLEKDESFKVTGVDEVEAKENRWRMENLEKCEEKLKSSGNYETKVIVYE